MLVNTLRGQGAVLRDHLHVSNRQPGSAENCPGFVRKHRAKTYRQAQNFRQRHRRCWQTLVQ